MKPLRERGVGCKLLSEEQFRIIFSDIELIHVVNTELLSTLQPVISKWEHNTCLGKSFKKMVASLVF